MYAKTFYNAPGIPRQIHSVRGNYGYEIFLFPRLTWNAGPFRVRVSIELITLALQGPLGPGSVLQAHGLWSGAGGRGPSIMALTAQSLASSNLRRHVVRSALLGSVLSTS